MFTFFWENSCEPGSVPKRRETLNSYITFFHRIGKLHSKVKGSRVKSKSRVKI